MTALYDLYNSTGGQNWEWNGAGAEWTFTPTANPCQDLWQGVVCALPSPYTTSYVHQIALSQTNLVGTLPDSVGNFTYMATLSLPYNSINGTIPASIERLTRLTNLALHHNELSGTIPDAFTRMEFMSSLDLSYNFLNGTVPPTVYSCHEMYSLTLSENFLHGTIPADIGETFFDLSSLSLCCNAFSGSIPFTLSWIKNLRYVELYENQLTGTLVPELSHLGQLKELSVRQNFLHGTIPASYGNLTNLRTLYLNTNNFTGTIPATLGNITLLQYLILDQNGLNGTIPATLGALTQLQMLSFSRNHLTGSLPDVLCGLPLLTSLDVGYNNLTGTLPQDLGNLTALTNLVLHTNRLSGTLPESFGRLTALEVLQAETNRFISPLPASMSGMTSLYDLEIYENRFTGPFPMVLCELSGLRILALETNGFTGPLPACVGQLTRLYNLALYSNAWSGTLPPEWGNLHSMLILSAQFCGNITGPIPDSYSDMQSLAYLTLGGNRLNGTIPSFLGSLSQLQYLGLGRNKFTGSIPPELGDAPRLMAVDIGSNRLTGTIPTSLGDMPSVLYLSVGNNFLIGTIPGNLGSLTNLRTLNLGPNRLTGSIPAELGELMSVAYLGLNDNDLTGSLPPALFDTMYGLSILSLYNNDLSGTLPSALSRLSVLNTLSLQHNRFSGTLDGLFDPTTQYFLQTIELTSNEFSGTLPAEVFQLPSLQTFVAIGNCFVGTLPAAICQAQLAQTLELDALHSAGTCQTKLFHGLGTYITPDAVHGTIPSCVFSLPYLHTLHLSSNALSGSLPSDVTMPGELYDLDLSHNQLTGSIPVAIQYRQWYSLDLSNNRLSGTLSPHFLPVFSQALAMNLKFNRLSGKIPGTLVDAAIVDILTSNVFSCKSDHSDLPANDPYVDIYQCASDTTDTPYYAWLACAALATVVLGAVYVVQDRAGAKEWVTQQLGLCRTWLALSDPTARSHLSYISSVFTAFCWTGGWIALYCVLILAPVYCILTAYYGTHTYEYIWSVSAVLKAGTVALSLQFALYYLLLCLFVVVYVRQLGALDASHLTDRTASQASEARAATDATQWSNYEPALYCTVYVVINFAVVGVVNAYYVFLKLNSAPSFQLTISAFKVVWNGYCSPALSRYFLRPRTQHSSLELFVALTNTIAIPVLAMAFVSPDCFYHAFVQEDAVSIASTVDVCLARQANGHCVADGPATDVASFRPPFVYNYQCTYSFAEFYVPAFVYVCLFNVFGTPLLEVGLSWLHHRASPGTRWFAVIDRITPRIHKATTESAAPVQRSNPLRPYFDATQFSIAQLTYICLLLTFGAVFPPLAASIALTMVCTIAETRLKVGRFLTSAKERGHTGYGAIVEQECAGVASLLTLQRALWMIFAFAAVFLGLFMFDTIGTSRGFQHAYWVLFAFPAATVGIYAVYVAVVRWRPDLLSSSGSAGADNTGTSSAPAGEGKTRLQSGSTTVRTFSAMQAPASSATTEEMTFNVLLNEL
jgi:Leucine-rich repeat (LRR) protein